jgi:ankyrin repeat protein
MLVKELLAKGADMNLQTKEGSTTLSIASKKGHTDVVKLLKKAGAK